MLMGDMEGQLLSLTTSQVVAIVLASLTSLLSQTRLPRYVRFLPSLGQRSDVLALWCYIWFIVSNTLISQG